jgi:hypothetical protein
VKRLAVIALTAVATLTAAAGGVAAMFYTVEPNMHGRGYMLISREQAQECADGGGCNVLSARQMAALFMMLATQGAQAEPAAPKQKGRSDI